MRWWCGAMTSSFGGAVVSRMVPIILIIMMSIENGHACTVNIASLCKCTSLLTGIQVDCSYMNFTEVVKALDEANTRIQKFVIHHSDIDIIPDNAFGNLWIKEIDLSGNGLKEISENAFSDRLKSSIQNIDLSNNSFVDIPNLKGFENLAIFDISGNLLSEIPPKSFDKLSNLQILRIGGNKICNLDRDSLNETKSSLTLLDLSGNCFSRVPAENLRGFLNLAWLDLSENKINDLPNLVFTNMQELRELHLEQNSIRFIAPLAFMNVGKLQALYLGKNMISTILGTKFETFENLEILDLSDNQMFRLGSSSFRDLPKLKQINLDGNKISQVDTLTFSNLPVLQLLSLQRNNMNKIFRNAFDNLPSLVILLLANNSFTQLEQSQLAGIPMLQQLNLRNNDIDSLGVGSFDLVPNLMRLDLGENKLTTLPPNTFVAMNRLNWLDLSDNQITSFGKDTFVNRIPNVIIHGNPMVCDESVEWFVNYLVKNRVRTFLPHQSEVICEAPDAKKGTRLKDLMIKKANETFFKNIQEINTVAGEGTALNNALRSIAQNGGGNGLAALQGLQSGIPLAKLLPGLASQFPGLANLQELAGFGQSRASMPVDPITGLSSFTGPLSNLIGGGPTDTAGAEVNKLLSGLPKFVQSLPNPNVNSPGAVAGFPGLDLNKLPPGLIEHVLKGGKIPGIPDAVVQNIVSQYLKNAQAKIVAQEKQTVGQSIVPETNGLVDVTHEIPKTQPVSSLPTFDSLPKEVIAHVMQGGDIPGLSREQTESLKQHYLRQLANSVKNIAPISDPLDPNDKSDITDNSPKFDLSILPPDVVKDIAQGKLPDLTKVPKVFVDLLQSNPKLIANLQEASRKKLEAEDPDFRFDSAVPSFSQEGRPKGFDLNKLEGKPTNSKPENRHIAWIIGVVLGVIGVATVAVITCVCMQRQRNRTRLSLADDNSSTGGGKNGLTNRAFMTDRETMDDGLKSRPRTSDDFGVGDGGIRSDDGYSGDQSYPPGCYASSAVHRATSSRQQDPTSSWLYGDDYR